MSTLSLADGTKLEYRAEYQTFTSIGGPVPDPEWVFTDAAGHEHKYGTPDTPYPTLKPVWTLGYCCTCNDTHEEGELLEYYECAQCGEEIKPHKKWYTPPPTTFMMYQEFIHSGWKNLEPGDDTTGYHRVEGGLSSIVRGYFERSISPEEAKRLVAEIGPPERRPVG